MESVFSKVSREISERHRQIIIIWQSLPVLSKVLMLICWTVMIPFLFALTFIILLILVFAIPGLFLLFRLNSIIDAENSNTGDMKVHTFYSITEGQNNLASFPVTPVVGVVFGGIHCAGWFFNFPSNDEAILWRVCSAILIGIAFLLPIHFILLIILSSLKSFHWLVIIISVLTLLVYVVSRLLLLVEAVISLRHLTPGMLALVKWTSFIPHI